MFSETTVHPGMAGWSEGMWQWMMGFHGLLSLFFLTVIVFAIVALIRDRRRDHLPHP